MLAGRVKLCWRVVLTKKLGGLRNQGAQETKETKETKELRNEGTKELRNEMVLLSSSIINVIITIFIINIVVVIIIPCFSCSPALMP